MSSETMFQSWTKLHICRLQVILYHKQQYNKPRIHDSILTANISVSMSYGMESSDRKFIALEYTADSWISRTMCSRFRARGCRVSIPYSPATALISCQALSFIKWGWVLLCYIECDASSITECILCCQKLSIFCLFFTIFLHMRLFYTFLTFHNFLETKGRFTLKTDIPVFVFLMFMMVLHGNSPVMHRDKLTNIWFMFEILWLVVNFGNLYV